MLNLAWRAGRAVLASLLIAALLTVPRPAQADATATLYLAPSRYVKSAGEKFVVDVSIATNEPVRGIKVGLSFDPTLVQLDEVVEGDFLYKWAMDRGARAVVRTQPTIDNNAGRATEIEIVIEGESHIAASGGGTVCLFYMTAKPGVRGRSPLNLEGVVLQGMAGQLNVGITGGEVIVGTPVTLSVSPTAQSVAPGGSTSVDVVADAALPTRGFQLEFAFDPALVQVDEILEGPYLRDWAASNGVATVMVPQPAADNQAGRIDAFAILIAGDAQGGATGSGVVCTLKLTAREGVAGTSPITIVKALVADAAAKELPAEITNGEVTVDSGAARAGPTSGEAAAGEEDSLPTATVAAATAPEQKEPAQSTNQGSVAKSETGAPSPTRAAQNAGSQAAAAQATAATATVSGGDARRRVSVEYSYSILPGEIASGFLGALLVAGGVGYVLRRGLWWGRQREEVEEEDPLGEDAPLDEHENYDDLERAWENEDGRVQW